MNYQFTFQLNPLQKEVKNEITGHLLVECFAFGFFSLILCCHSALHREPCI